MARLKNDVRDLATATDIQKRWIKLLTRPSGATRAELQEATGSPFAPDWWHLDRLAWVYGFDAYADKPKTSDFVVYQFVPMGKAPTAYGRPPAARRVNPAARASGSRR